MNWDILKGKWDQAEAQMRARWSKLTDDDIGTIRAKNQELVGRLRERYGWAKDETERNVDQFLRDMSGGKKRVGGGNASRGRDARRQP